MATKETQTTPAEDLLRLLGPIPDHMQTREELGDFGLPTRGWMEDFVEGIAKGSAETDKGVMATPG